MKILVNSFIAFYLNSCLFVVLFFFLHVQLQRVLLFQLMTESRTHNGKDVSYFFLRATFLYSEGFRLDLQSLLLRDVTLTIPLQPYTKTKSTIFTNTSTDKTPTYSLLRRSRKMVKYLF